MDREPIVGECLVVTRGDSSMPARVGDRVVVTHVDDDDSTFRGRWSGATSAECWVSWSVVEPVEFGWEFVRRHLPAEVASLLGSCRRIEFLTLNSQAKRALVDALPDWRERVMTAIATTECGAGIQDDEQDDDDDEDTDDDDLE